MTSAKLYNLTSARFLVGPGLTPITGAADDDFFVYTPPPGARAVALLTEDGAARLRVSMEAKR